MKMLIALAALCAAGAPAMLAQEEDGPPPVLQIGRELIKEGKMPAHETTEAAFVQAFRKANFPGHYVGLSPLSGSNEVWFVAAYPSFEMSEKWQAEAEKEPLKHTLEIADAQDGDLRERSNTLWAVYRPQLSYRPDNLDLGKTRFVRVLTYHVRPGHAGDFVEQAGVVIHAYDRANIDRSFVGYEVKAGAPAGMYLFFEGMTSLKTLDAAEEQNQAFISMLGAERLKKLDEFDAEGVISEEINLFQVNPTMSYVSKATEDEDPAFWRPKPPAVKPTAAARAKSGN
ncbi:MAG: hypothetical protein ABSH00_14695 [Bryobacteraceae bacterium]|jgi:hypothetical protein